MTATLYKQQAKRLLDHLSQVHKFRLKHASALEAIAAVHNTRDWNTLNAQGPSALTPHHGDAVVSVSSGSRNVLFPRHSFSEETFADALLSSTTHVKDAPRGETDAMLTHLLTRQVARGGGLLYLDAAGAQKMRLERLCRVRAPGGGSFKTLQMTAPAESHVFNLLESGDADALASICLAALPASDSVGADFYRQTANYALTVIFFAMLEAREPITFERCAQILQRPGVELQRLVSMLQKDSPALNALTLLQSNYTRSSEKGSQFDTSKFQQNMGGIGGRMALLAQGHIGRLLTAEPGAETLSNCLREGDVVYVDLGPTPVANLERAFLRSLREAVWMNQHSAMRRPFTVFVDGARDGWISGGFISLAKRMGVGVVVTGEADAAALDMDHCARVTAPGGFGRSAEVTLTSIATGASLKAELLEAQ